MKNKRIIPNVPPEERSKLPEGYGTEFKLFETLKRFYDWSYNELIYRKFILVYAIWMLILYLIVRK
jgi:hypothetical protein